MTKRKIALTRGISASIDRCEVSFIDRVPIDVQKMKQQHRAYEEMLQSMGYEVIQISADDSCPDCCFIEDTALVLDEIAVITHPGSTARRAEVPGVVSTIEKFRKTVKIEPPATLEGGDVLRIGRNLYVGLTQRTNVEGVGALRKLVAPYGYTVTAVPTPGALHMKSVCTAANDRTVVADPTRMDVSVFANYDVVEISPEEWMGGDLLPINGTVCMIEGFPKLKSALEGRGLNVRTLNMSEFMKAEAGLTCLSLLFEES
jgi:dimethylargininase